ncbi:MAG: ribonuclease III family protein [Candidatus Bathyarchaeia archaeon]
MSNEETRRKVMDDKQLASLGDAFVNFVYSLALTNNSGKPQGVKVSDRILAEAFRRSDLRKYLGTRVSRKDLANASESLLVKAYQRKLITIEESVKILSENPAGLEAGLSELMKLAAERIVPS